MKLQLKYGIEASWLGEWALVSQDDSLLFLKGRMSVYREMGGPRAARRLVRQDGKVIEEVPLLEEASLGQMVGMPSAEQYRQAAERCLEKACQIEMREARVALGRRFP